MKLPHRPTGPKQPHGASGRAEFESCLERDFPALVGQLYAITLNARAVRGHVQDGYAEAWRKWSAIRDLPDPASWVRTAAIGYSRVWVRRAGQRAVDEPEGPWPPTSPGSRALFDALGTTPEDGRRCLVLYHVVGLPVDVIANIEQVAVGEVHAVLARTHDHLLGGMREARDHLKAAERDGAEAERLVAACAWDDDKTAALQALVAELASSVATPGMSAIARRAGSQHRATSAAAIAVLAVGALGGVTIAMSAVGQPTTEMPSGTAVGAATTPPAGPTLIPAEPIVSPTATRTRSPIARPRPTPRVRITTTPPTTTATTGTTPTTTTGTSTPTTTTTADAR